MIIRSYLNPSKACTEATSGITGDLLLRYSASTSVLASLCPTDLPQGLPEDTEPKEGTGIRGRNRKEQGRKASADGALARESHVGVLWHTLLETNLTSSLTGLRSGVTVKTLMSTGRKKRGV